MSWLEELIRTLHPNGVEYSAIKDCCVLRRGDSITRNSTNEGPIPVIAGGQRPAYFVDKANRTGETIVVSSSGAYAGYVSYWNTPIFVSDAFSIEAKKGICLKFIFHFLKNRQEIIHSLKKGGGVPHVHVSDLAPMRIPIPPLPIQEEIVRILDTFTALETELEAELAARTKQYEHYRYELMSFDSNSKIMENLFADFCLDEVEFIPLEQVLDYSQPTPYIVKSTLYDDSYDTPVLTAGASFILGYTEEKKGIYNASHEKPVIIFDDFTTSFHWVDFNFKVKSSAMKILTEAKQKIAVLRYVFYAMQCIKYLPSQHARQWIQTYSKIQIPLPPLPVQEEIVSILDKFDTLINDLKSGLPAEIALRRKQYEYYRDKLLTFTRRA